MEQKLVAGVDFGTDSVRAIIVNVDKDETIASETCYYARWQEKKYCNSAQSQFRQHPNDYLDGLETCMRSVMKQIGQENQSHLLAIAIDTTGSTPCPVDQYGVPLAMKPEFAENPNAMFHLWKDHTSVDEAKEVNRIFSAWDPDYTQYQGVYSSEWFWAKILHTVRADPQIKEHAWSWVEHCDWIPALLIGQTDPSTMYRGACAAGHKALWHSKFGGLPSQECLEQLDPYLAQIARRYTMLPQPAGANLGTITPEWADRLAVPRHTILAGGSFDAHAGAVGAGILPCTMVKVVGTSTVDMLIESPECLPDRDMRNYCGQAENSIIPGYIGIEAGQAAFGDVFSWWTSVLLQPFIEMLQSASILSEKQREQLIQYAQKNIIGQLEQAALREENAYLIALDWLNGRRYPNLNEDVKGAIFGLTLGATAPEIFRALIVSTVFGSRRIFESLVTNGIEIDRLIAVGGIAQKSPFTMQLLADVLKIPVMVSKKEQICAFGSAIYASVAAGLFKGIPAAQAALCEPYQTSYFPDERQFQKYDVMYQKYLKCGDFIENNGIR